MKIYSEYYWCSLTASTSHPLNWCPCSISLRSRCLLLKNIPWFLRICEVLPTALWRYNQIMLEGSQRAWIPQPSSRHQSSQCKRNERPSQATLLQHSWADHMARTRADVETPKDEAARWGRTPPKAPPESSQLKPYPGMACFDFVWTGAKMVLTALQLSSVWFKAQPDVALLTNLPSCLPLRKL